MTESPQQQQHWLGEQVLNWSGVPVAHVRSTIFLEPLFSSKAALSTAKDGTIRLPFGSARTSPISASDVAIFSRGKKSTDSIPYQDKLFIHFYQR